ncbi:MAG: garA 1 [Gemmataceae bacterium]|nr:garA 1 [Gemmataceae bacterium]
MSATRRAGLSSSEPGVVAMQVQFRVVNSKEPEVTYTVWKSPYVVGRHKDCDIRVVNKAVSVRHCAFLLGDDRVWVRDLDSTNGTRVNGKPIHGDRELFHGDKIWVGPAIIELILSEPGADPLAAGSSCEYTPTHVYGFTDDPPPPPKAAPEAEPRTARGPRKPREGPNEKARGGNRGPFCYSLRTVSAPCPRPTIRGPTGNHNQLHPLVSPQVSHFAQAPLRTSVSC